MKALQPGCEIAEHGIRFNRLKNGDGRFSIDLRVDGQRIHRVLGLESEGVTRVQAEQFIEKVRTEAREGRLNLARGRKVAMGFKTAAYAYLKRLEEVQGKDKDKKKQRLELHLIPFFGEKPISQNTTFDIERYKKHRKDLNAKHGTINRELALISHLLNMAVDWSWIRHRPCKIKKFKEEPSRFTYLTTEQCQRLLYEASRHPNPHLYPFIFIALNTCMRKSEILSIRIENIDLECLRIFIPTAKSGARIQPITRDLAQFLESYLINLKSCEWLFPASHPKTGHVVWIEKPFREAVKAAGLNPKEVVRHTLRHTAITHLVQAGVDLPTVMSISGHKSLQMGQRYSHQNGSHIQAAMDKLQERINFPIQIFNAAEMPQNYECSE